MRGAAGRAAERPATGAVTANHLGLLAGRAPVHPERDLVQRSPSGTRAGAAAAAAAAAADARRDP